jgi:adenylosuccinate lyase
MQRALRAFPQRRFSSLPLSPLTGVSSIDGRYASQTASLRPYLSEYALIRNRVIVELEWLRELSGRRPHIGSELPRFDAAAERVLSDIVANFGLAAAERVKAIEATTNHDVKAVEYYLKEAFAASGNRQLQGAAEFLHFAATSEDVNNLAYALMVKGARDEVLAPAMTALVGAIVDRAEAQADVAMLSRTHGQPATPSTMGKEWANWAHRMARQLAQLRGVPALGKFNGAVGSFNAHVCAYPTLDWQGAAQALVQARLGLAYQPYSTQIEPHDWLAEVFHALARFNTVLLDLDRDVWGYISLGYFKQVRKAGEVGSSTMPHKVNPIDFENSEGNVGLANALLGHLAEKLPVSRYQRDLSDSTVLRSIGSAFGHTLLAVKSAQKGLGKLEVDSAVIKVRRRPLPFALSCCCFIVLA